MTTIAIKGGIMAADSQATISTEEGGSNRTLCEKIYRVGNDIIGLAGESAPGLVFLDWYIQTMTAPTLIAPEMLVHGEADFTALVLKHQGSAFEYDKWCRPERVIDYDVKKCYAIGSGRKVAMGAMLAGKSAKDAVEIACSEDAHSGKPVVTMSFPKPPGHAVLK